MAGVGGGMGGHGWERVGAAPASRLPHFCIPYALRSVDGAHGWAFEAGGGPVRALVTGGCRFRLQKGAFDPPQTPNWEAFRPPNDQYVEELPTNKPLITLRNT